MYVGAIGVTIDYIRKRIVVINHGFHACSTKQNTIDWMTLLADRRLERRGEKERKKKGQPVKCK